MLYEMTVVSVRSFSRRSGKTGQEVLVMSGSTYPAIVQAPDKEDLDLSDLRQNDLVKFEIELGFTSVQCVSDNDKKYYKRIPTFKIVNIL